MVMIVSHLAISGWVYYDARKRGLDNPGEWAALALVPAINLFGLAAYMAGRDLVEREE